MNKLFSCIILLVLPTLAFSQVEKDARFWTELGLSKEINDLELSFGLEYRLDENFSHTDKILGEIGAEYKLNKRLAINTGYRYTKDNDFESYDYQLSHRFDVGVEYDNKIKWWGIKDLKFKYRIKYQVETAPRHENNKTYIRNKFSLDYKKYDLSPSISYEFHYQFNDQMVINRSRVSVGVKYDLTKKTSIECFYILENKFNTKNLKQGHIYGIGYSIDL